jgi:CcmD family protein
MNVVLEAGVAIYVALLVALAVWVGLFVYLWRLDVQARDLRRRLEQMPEQNDAPAPSVTLRAQAPTDKGAGTQEPRTASAE